ncbi:MAG: regulatory protein RecX [Bacteroidia bacterium]
MHKTNENKKVLSDEQIYAKLAKYCAYQERCQKEVFEKLKQLNVFGIKAEAVVARLISENYLNEERFAIAFACGKNRVKGWGHIKIVNHLKQLNLSDKLIQIAIKQLDNAEYQKKLNQIIEKKWPFYKSKFDFNIAKLKITHFLISKGYNVDLVKESLMEFFNSQNEK